MKNSIISFLWQIATALHGSKNLIYYLIKNTPKAKCQGQASQQLWECTLMCISLGFKKSFTLWQIAMKIIFIFIFLVSRQIRVLLTNLHYVNFRKRGKRGKRYESY